MNVKAICAVTLGIAALHFATACFGADDSKEDTAAERTELGRLQGEWVLTAFETRDRYSTSFIMPSTFDGKMIIKGDTVEYSLLCQGQKEEHVFRLTLDPTTDPKHYDEIHPNNSTIKGIYELTGDTMKQCTNLDDGPRTPSFESGQLYVWKRKKSETESEDPSPEGDSSTQSSERLKAPQEGKGATRAKCEGRENAAEVDADLSSHQGEWMLTAWEMRDAHSRSVISPATFEGQLRVNGDAAEVSGRIQGTEMKSSYRLQLDPTKTPKEFDAIIPDVGIVKGIYEFDGDTLKRCSGKLNGPRPPNFEAGNYHVWKRKQPQEGGRDIDAKKVDSGEAAQLRAVESQPARVAPRPGAHRHARPVCREKNRGQVPFRRLSEQVRRRNGDTVRRREPEKGSE